MDAIEPGNDKPSRNYRWWMVGPEGAARAPRWWIQDVLIAVVIGVVLLAGQEVFDDMRSQRELDAAEKQSEEADRRENLRFVRDRSGAATVERPFQNMNLHGQNLVGLQLEGANFRGAHFDKDSSMWDINLRNADLRDAWLLRTIMSGANLSGADLRGAFLDGASLVGADLTGADLRGASLDGTDLGGADLTDAELSHWGLKTVCHNDNTVWPEGFEPPNPNQRGCVPHMLYWNERDPR